MRTSNWLRPFSKVHLEKCNLLFFLPIFLVILDIDKVKQTYKTTLNFIQSLFAVECLLTSIILSPPPYFFAWFKKRCQSRVTDLSGQDKRNRDEGIVLATAKERDLQGLPLKSAIQRYLSWN